MRSVVFVERLELDFEGNLFANGLMLGDVDNDGENELVVGNTEGQLYVFKGDSTVPWAVACNLGITTCVGIGDVCNKGRNFIITVSAEGLCHIFDLETIKKSKEVEAKGQKDARSKTESKASKDSKGQKDVKSQKDVNQKSQKEPKTAKDGSKQPDGKGQLEAKGQAEGKGQGEVKGQCKPFELYPCHTQHLPANTKMLLIQDIDGGGQVELVVGHTDRTVRAYTWRETPAKNDGRSSLGGKFVLLQKWNLQGQVGSLSLSRHEDGSPKLVVSQPGCNYSELLCNWVKGQEVGTGDAANPSDEAYIKWHPISSRRARNSNVSTEIVANIRLGEDTSKESTETKPHLDRLALCTLDGTLMMIEEDKILWSLLVDHQLFAVTKLDINCDDRDEVVFCAWDGQTYIVDHSQEVVRFQLEENAAAFTAGQYSAKGKNMPCLVYVTFTKQIYVYWNVCLPRIPSASLHDLLESNDEVQEQLKMLDLDGSTAKDMRQLVQWCIYGNQSKPTDDTR